MLTVSQMVLTELEIFNQSIRDSLDGKNITNTGTAKQSLRVTQTGSVYESIGIFYLEFLDSGRGKGGKPPIHKIQNWVKTKLGVTDEKKSLAIAFAVASKIQKLGTEIFKNPNRGIELDKKIALLKTNISNQLAESAKLTVTRELNFFLNKHK